MNTRYLCYDTFFCLLEERSVSFYFNSAFLFLNKYFDVSNFSKNLPYHRIILQWRLIVFVRCEHLKFRVKFNSMNVATWVLRKVVNNHIDSPRIVVNNMKTFKMGSQIHKGKISNRLFVYQALNINKFNGQKLGFCDSRLDLKKYPIKATQEKRLSQLVGGILFSHIRSKQLSVSINTYNCPIVTVVTVLLILFCAFNSWNYIFKWNHCCWPNTKKLNFCSSVFIGVAFERILT